MGRKYDLDDFEAVVRGEKTLAEIINKYGSNRKAIITAMNRNGFRFRKPVKMITPYKTMVFHTISECAEEIGVSYDLIWKELHGRKSATLKDLEIEVMYYEDTN